MACSVKKIVVVCVLVMFNLGIYAQTTKVVVIPTEGDNPASQFRIESAGTSTEESLERLEYTAGLPQLHVRGNQGCRFGETRCSGVPERHAD